MDKREDKRQKREVTFKRNSHNLYKWDIRFRKKIQSKKYIWGRRKMYKHIKRGLDFFIGMMLLILLLPILGIIALCIKLDSKGPILFKQKRVGKDEEYFMIWKFRTMRVDTPSDMPTHLLENPEIHITRVGKFLRKSSLDELPQIFNILRGQMSFIGPRPALWNQEDLIEQRHVCGVDKIMPGLTGWAQVNGRDELEIPVKVTYDKEYLEQMSLKMDIQIVYLTIKNVLRGKGVVEGIQSQCQEEVKV